MNRFPNLRLAAVAAVLLSGCTSIPEQRQIPESTWRAFQTSGHNDNRLHLHNNALLDKETRAMLGPVAVIAENKGAALDAQRPLTRGQAAWRTAKLWVGWENSRPAWRLAPGRYQSSRDGYHSATTGGFSGSGDGAAIVALGYLVYVPFGLTAGAISGAASVPGEARVGQLMVVLSNTLVRAQAPRLLADSILRELRRSDRGLVVHPELIRSGAQPQGVSSLEVSLDNIRLEGGVKPNASLWLTLDWSAKLRSADAAETIYATGGIWQSHEERKLHKWAVEDGELLERSLREACHQIAVVLGAQIAGP